MFLCGKFLREGALTIIRSVLLDVITSRIPSDLKAKMKKHSEINWSEVLREAIIKRIEIEERLEAVREIDEVKRRMRPVEKGQLDRWLKEDRGR